MDSEVYPEPDEEDCEGESERIQVTHGGGGERTGPHQTYDQCGERRDDELE
ncbi:MAG: hypothetical protein JRG92_11635 [Deltaproteobacteria bacterium]|nr:hypothetical protein [Deltaproteobacteria bacterium]